MPKLTRFNICLLVITLSLSGCSWKNHSAKKDSSEANLPPVPADHSSTAESNKNKDGRQTDSGVQIVTTPEMIPVLVNKHHMLPDDYNPSDLVDPNIQFIFAEKLEKRKMRAKAATAIEMLFTAAKQDGINLLGVSAYRSHSEQTSLFNHYVNVDGYEAAMTYSAVPGTSEHETGLAIDVTGGNGKCAAEDCFKGTPEADWLQKHAADYGFIIRYPKGKEQITGYQYEPWHLRYVGKTIAKKIMDRGITLEEYYNTAAVNNGA
ncbi:M15 family metallopeptidase [Neobacillus sp. OS1-2]|uniref:M15 family metallopeptidase n=1 Tax=Neobacillus sp. OS1-2 TaxID=3070680 RepID=UPI0027DF5952|nr:M15 family metallopeptidase [Neobacillus sp. OS1-2]WML41282.1 M15 family metallopeptidase [Neobacillus sp. OS1-2]